MLKNLYSFNLREYWRNVDKIIFFSFLILFVLGVFFSFASTSSLAGERLNKDYYFFFSKHLIFSIISIILMTLISSIENQLFKKTIIPIFIISCVTLFLVLFIGVEVKGSKRWLDLFFFRLQPIEFLKPFFVVMVAIVLSKNDFMTTKMNYFFSFLILLFPSILLLNQPDVGQTILLVLTWLATIFISGIELIYIFILGIFFILSLILLFLIFPERFFYILKRFEVFLIHLKVIDFRLTKH